MYYDNREQLLAIDGTAPIDYKWRRRGDDIFVVTIPEVDGYSLHRSSTASSLAKLIRIISCHSCRRMHPMSSAAHAVSHLVQVPSASHGTRIRDFVKVSRSWVCVYLEAAQSRHRFGRIITLVRLKLDIWTGEWKISWLCNGWTAVTTAGAKL